MSGKKPEKDIQHIDTIRCIIGFGTGWDNTFFDD